MPRELDTVAMKKLTNLFNFYACWPDPRTGICYSNAVKSYSAVHSSITYVFICPQLHAAISQSEDVESLGLGQGSSLVNSLKQRVVSLASNCGVLSTVQMAAQATLQSGWSILLPTAEERARALSTLLANGGKRALLRDFSLMRTVLLEWHQNNGKASLRKERAGVMLPQPYVPSEIQRLKSVGQFSLCVSFSFR